MATIMSSMSPASPQPTPPADLTGISPITTDGTVKRPSYQQRSSSFSKERLSTYSNASFTSQNRSRPGSHVFPVFHSSLSYALVRDFAYPSFHPLHYGPPPPASAASTPLTEQRRLSDPPASWDGSRGQWSSGVWSSDNSNHGHQRLPAMSFGDGPPYSEDEDLHSPVVTTRHRKNKSTGTDLNGRRGRSHGRASQGPGSFSREDDRGTLVSMNSDGSETYYVDDEDATEDGPGGEFVTYPADEGRYSRMVHGGDHGYDPDMGFDSDDDDDDDDDDYSNVDRYSRDYQFAVGCPDEEMHGRAVALFDFTREHENELPLVEGQVIYVSYRQSQGWLVAEDPKTGESGLVPEEFVRLLRDIEGGLNSLNGEEPDDNNPDSTTESSEPETDNNTYLSPDSTTTESEDQAVTPSVENDNNHHRLPLSASDTHSHSSPTPTTTNGDHTNGNSHRVVISAVDDPQQKKGNRVGILTKS